MSDWTEYKFENRHLWLQWNLWLSVVVRYWNPFFIQTKWAGLITGLIKRVVGRQACCWSLYEMNIRFLKEVVSFSFNIVTTLATYAGYETMRSNYYEFMTDDDYC